MDPNEAREQDTQIDKDAANEQLQIITARMTRDMKFVSVFVILYGILYSLTIIGAVVGIPLIIAGIRLKDSASDYSTFSAAFDRYSLLKAFKNQQSFFFITKILIIVAIVLLLLYLLTIYLFYSYMIDMVNGVNMHNPMV